MIRRPPRSHRTDTLFPYTSLFRSLCWVESGRVVWRKLALSNKPGSWPRRLGTVPRCRAREWRPARSAPVKNMTANHKLSGGSGYALETIGIFRELDLREIERLTQRVPWRNYKAHQQIICHQERSEEHTSELQSLMRTSYAVFCLTQ